MIIEGGEGEEKRGKGGGGERGRGGEGEGGGEGGGGGSCVSKTGNLHHSVPSNIIFLENYLYRQGERE